MTNDVLLLAHTLKGAPLSCLFVLRNLHEPLTATELATYTGYNRKPIAEALAKLQALKLTTTTPAGQHVLNTNPEAWGENIPTGSSSSSYESIESIESLKLQLHGGDKISPHPLSKPGNSALTAKLVGLGCERRRAEKALSAALNHHPPRTVEGMIDDWLAYCNTEAGKGIKARGFFIAARLTANETAPQVEQQPAHWYEENADLIQR